MARAKAKAKAKEHAGDGLEVLGPEVAAWFRSTYGVPTPPQRGGWPVISAGRNTLICAPTGSGKTLAAFLACLDHLWKNPRTAPGVRIVYISPLKALNEDVRRNLEVPLAGIVAEAEAAGRPLPALRAAVRTGDTPAAERQRMARRPPDILITTPESLHLLLTSRARETLRSVSHVLVDEIHALCPNKRGIFLALLLERLEAINPAGLVRVGLSATQRPLEEVARYLGGRRRVSGPDGSPRFEARPVTIVDAGHRKDLDLEVSYPAADLGPAPPGGATWPAIERRLLGLIEGHRSTIVFANNRRVVERLTAHLNELAAAESEAEAPPAGDEDEPRIIAQAHHGSLSQERRRSTEEALKRGELPAVVATGTLELGLDMGAVDLVCQVESPGGIARGLQRVGRAGHLVGGTSKGRLLAKTTGDLLESAALAGAMLRGEVEPLRVPTNALDVLAQQVVACVAVDRWEVPALFEMIRCAYPYRDLTAEAFEGVLGLVSGRFHAGSEPLRDLRPRLSWDRVHNRLHPLPGTAQAALVGGGTIPDTGQYPLYLGEGGPRLGELDEEFVLERRVGETFALGTSTWTIEAIEPGRVLVGPAEGRPAMMPFWRGEAAARTPELGEAVGALCRELVAKLDDPGGLDWLRDAYRLDPPAARRLRDHVAHQVRSAGAVPDDRTTLVESFRDPVGEVGLAVLTPFGGKLHQALKLALTARLRRRLGVEVASLHADDGILFRLPRTEEPPLGLLDGLTADEAEDLVREALGESALFGLRFRQAAGRALLLPRPDPGKRAPLWLQRLRARDLLQVARQLPDFPIVVETYRECLDDDLDLPRLRAFLDGIADGSTRVVAHRGEIASPFASDLIFRFTQAYTYEWDQPRRGDLPPAPAAVSDDLLDPLLRPGASADLLDPTAVGRVEGRLRGVGRPPRTVDEMAEWLRRLGDLTETELSGPMAGFLADLESQGRALRIDLAGTASPSRWIGAEEAPLYDSAFGPEGAEADREAIVRRFFRTHALVGLDDLTARYPIDPVEAADRLEHLVEEGMLVPLEAPDGSGSRWADRKNLEDARRLTVAIRRREGVAVRPEVFADFVSRRQHVHPETRLEGSAAVALVFEQLQGFAAPADLWESEVLPRRVRDYRPAWLDEALTSGGWSWRAEAEGRGEPRSAFVPRGFAGPWPTPAEPRPEPDGPAATVLGHLDRRGASFVDEIATGTILAPSLVREALEGLIRLGLATNDRFDPLRPGARARAEALAIASADRDDPPSSRTLGSSRRSTRRPRSDRPEGRWSLLPVGVEADEEALLGWASVLFERYGVLTRETVAIDSWAPAWRVLAPALDRAEWRGEVRRGYFVEGLSGVQYVKAEAADDLARLAGSPGGGGPPVLISTLDPANLYGSGAPLDIPLLEGGTARLGRSSTSWLVLDAGRPTLIVEGQGRRLTGLASASEADLKAAVGLLPSLANPSRRVLKVETYNNAAALASPAAPWLTEVGFVRDYPGLAFYAGW